MRRRTRFSAVRRSRLSPPPFSSTSLRPSPSPARSLKPFFRSSPPPLLRHCGSVIWGLSRFLPWRRTRVMAAGSGASSGSASSGRPPRRRTIGPRRRHAPPSRFRRSRGGTGGSPGSWTPRPGSSPGAHPASSPPPSSRSGLAPLLPRRQVWSLLILLLMYLVVPFLELSVRALIF